MPLTYQNRLTVGVTGCPKFISRAFFIWDWWGKQFILSPYCQGLYFLTNFNLHETQISEHKQLIKKYYRTNYTKWISLNPYYEQYYRTIPKTNVPHYKVEHLTRPFSYFQYIMKTPFRWSLRVDDGAYIKVDNLHLLMKSLNFLPDPLYHPVLQGCCFPAFPHFFGEQGIHVEKTVRRIVIQGGSGHLTSRYFVKEILAVAPEITRLQDYDDDWQMGDWGLKAGISQNEMGSPYFFSQTKDFWDFPTAVKTKRPLSACIGDLTPRKETCGVDQIVPLSKKVVFHEQGIYVHFLVDLMKMNLTGYALYHNYSLRISFCNWTAWKLEHPGQSDAD